MLQNLKINGHSLQSTAKGALFSCLYEFSLCVSRTDLSGNQMPTQLSTVNQRALLDLRVFSLPFHVILVRVYLGGDIFPLRNILDQVFCIRLFV